MSLREELLELLPDNVTKVEVSRGNVRGKDTVGVVTHWTDKAGKEWWVDYQFDTGNKMDASDMAALIKHHVSPKQDIDPSDWENEGGNGHHR